MNEFLKKEARTANSTYPKGGVSCSKDSFVVNRTFVFQIKFCDKSRHFCKLQNVKGKLEPKLTNG
jgi:hypothetical protein